MRSNENTVLSVVIVNWNSGIQLRACVDSIAEHSEFLVVQTIVVDNGSVDGSDASVEGLPNVTLLRTGANLGFGKACNLGAKEASGKFLLFLNPDAALYENTLIESLRYMQDPAHADVGICGVQLIDSQGEISRSCARFPSPMGFALHALGADRFFPGLGHAMLDWEHTQTRTVDHVIGAFFLVRREVFALLNGFDEKFFVYLEDLDFSYRARQAGWRSTYLADVQAFHVGGGTSNSVKAKRLFYSLRSRLVYARKHYSVAGMSLVFCSTFLVEPFSRFAHAALRRSWSTTAETWGAFRMLWRWLPEWMFKGTSR